MCIAGQVRKLESLLIDVRRYAMRCAVEVLGNSNALSLEVGKWREKTIYSVKVTSMQL